MLPLIFLLLPSLTDWSGAKWCDTRRKPQTRRPAESRRRGLGLAAVRGNRFWYLIITANIISNALRTKKKDTVVASVFI